MPVIDTAKTGENIKAMMKEKGVTTAALQIAMGFGTPQAIYKWFKGATMPTLDNLVILADVLGTTLDKIIVTDMI